MLRSASFSEGDRRKSSKKERTEAAQETKSLTSRGKSHNKPRRRNSQRRRSPRSPSDSLVRDEEKSSAAVEERHHHHSKQRKESSRRSSKDKESPNLSRTRKHHQHRSKSADRSNPRNGGKHDEVFLEKEQTHQRLSWHREEVCHAPTREANQQSNWNCRVLHQIDGMDNGARGSLSTSVSSSDDEDELDPDWAQWMSKAPALPRPTPLGGGDLHGRQDPGRRVVIRYSAGSGGSTSLSQTSTPTEVTTRTLVDDANITSPKHQGQMSDEKKKKSKFLASVARRIFGSPKKNKTVRDVEEVVEEPSVSSNRSFIPGRPQHIPSPPRRKAPQVDPQKAKKRPVARVRSNEQKTDSNQPKVSNNLVSEQEDSTKLKPDNKVETPIRQETSHIEMTSEEQHSQQEAVSSTLPNASSLHDEEEVEEEQEQEQEQENVCQNVVKIEFHPEPPSQFTLEQMKVHTSSPDPALIAANTYSGKPLGGSRPTSSTHQLQNVASRGNKLPFSIAAAARYAGISPALLRQLCADTKVVADGTPDCEAEDRETPNKQGYKALIRDHEAIRRSKSPSPPKGSDRSSRTSLLLRNDLSIVNDTLPVSVSREPGKCCNCSVRGDESRHHGTLPDDTFSDIPIYDCRDFPELGVSELFPGGPSRHGNDSGCQCQCVQKGCGWTGSEISNNVFDDRRRSVALRQFNLQSLMFGRPPEGVKSRIVIEDLDNAEGKAVQTISWLQSQMPYSRRGTHQRSRSPTNDDEKTSADSGYSSGGATGQPVPMGNDSGKPVLKQTTQNIARSILI